MNDLSLIDHPQWIQARWRDTMFLLTPDLDHPAGIALQFENYPAAKPIFSAWRSTFGEADKEERLRLSIIHGTAPTEEKGYVVHLSNNPFLRLDLKNPDPQDVAITSRFHFKETTSNQNLEWFIASYERHRKYFLFGTPIKPGANLEPYLSDMLWKSNFYHCDFDEIDGGHIDAIAVPRKK